MDEFPRPPGPDERCCTRLKHLSGYVGATCCDFPESKPESVRSEGEWDEPKTAT